MDEKENENLREMLAEADGILTRVGNALDGVVTDIERNYDSPPESVRTLNTHVDRLMVIVADVLLRVEALDPRAGTWHLRLVCADGIMYENDLLDTVIVPIELAAMLASGRRFAVPIDDLGYALGFRLPQGRKVIPKSLVALLAEDTYVETGAHGPAEAVEGGGA